MTATNVYIFWSYCPELWADLIVRVTSKLPDRSDAWSHMGIVFRLAAGELVYYEALYRQGFTGPKPLHKLRSWADRDAGRRLELAPTSIGPAGAELIRREAESWLGQVGYFGWQLVAMWAFERFGFPVRLSPRKVVCSEAVGRLLYPYLDLRDSERRTFDAVNPASAWRSYQAQKAANGGFTP